MVVLDTDSQVELNNSKSCYIFFLFLFFFFTFFDVQMKRKIRSLKGKTFHQEQYQTPIYRLGLIIIITTTTTTTTTIIIIIIIIVYGVGQAYALAYFGKLDAPAHQSLGWHLWQVPATPQPPCSGLRALQT